MGVAVGSPRKMEDLVSVGPGDVEVEEALVKVQGSFFGIYLDTWYLIETFFRIRYLFL